jgi:gluconokinase
MVNTQSVAVTGQTPSKGILNGFNPIEFLCRLNSVPIDCGRRIFVKTCGLILMGVAGSGKTTVGKALAERLGWDFFDADEAHPPENIAKMAAGVPLTDADRAPWLVKLNNLVGQTLRSGRHPVLACSALKRSYRDMLLQGNEGIKIVYLKGSYELIYSRMINRSDHYMQPGMLRSQLDALEEPIDALTVDIISPPEEIVDCICQGLKIETDN